MTTDENRNFPDDETTDLTTDENRDFPEEETTTDIEGENRNFPDEEEFTNFDLNETFTMSEALAALTQTANEIKAIEYFGVLTVWFLIGVVAASTAFKRW